MTTMPFHSDEIRRTSTQDGYFSSSTSGKDRLFRGGMT